MSKPRMRPTFSLPLRCAPDAFLDAFRRRLESPDSAFAGLVTRRHVFLRVPAPRQHFWSPQLELELRAPEPTCDADHEGAPTSSKARGTRRVHGRFSPHPHVWTMFMAIYGVLGIGGCAGLVWGLAQWTLGEAAWALLAVPASVALIAFVYGAAFIGQGLGSEQMYELRSFVDEVQRTCERDCGVAGTEAEEPCASDRARYSTR
jgi:hypothetical protein